MKGALNYLIDDIFDRCSYKKLIKENKLNYLKDLMKLVLIDHVEPCFYDIYLRILWNMKECVEY